MSFPEDETAHRKHTRGQSSAEPDESEPRLITRGHVTEPTHGSTGRLQLSDESIAPARAARPSPPRRRTLRWLSIGFAVLFVLSTAAVIASALWLRRSMRAALPVIDGSLHVAGLHAPVNIERNAQGVPCIHAATADDVLFAQGFVTAQDRLWQMDVLRRHAAGELAEILGPTLVAHDKRQRYLQLAAAADHAAQNLPPAQLHELQAYARGVNAFIASHRDRLPVEFHLLHYVPRAWTPRDSLLVTMVMWQDLSTSFPEKLARESLARHLPSALLADLYPTGSWRDRPPTQLKPDLTTPREIEEIPLDPTQSQLAPPNTAAPDLVAVASVFAPHGCTDCRAGSNNWAVSGAHSASGAPLVSNDMHLSLSMPDIWYEAALHVPATLTTPAVDVAGFTLPGVPWVLVGRNAHVAWSLTNLGADVQDVRIEHVRGSGPSLEVEQPDETWSPVRHHTERILVRTGRDVSVDVLTVSHPFGTSTLESPIISPLYPSEHRTLSLAWTVYDPGSVPASFASADEADSGASLVSALANFGGPSLNLVYADDRGHIGYHALGHVPIRGPAVQHPRNPEPDVIQPAEPESEPGSEPSDEEQNQQSSLPYTGLTPILVSFGAGIPPALRRDTLYSAQRAAHGQTVAYQRTHVGRRHPARPHGNVRPQPRPATPIQKTPPPAPPLAFTIGGAIAPVPVDALDAAQQWSGYIPYSQLPAIEDPPSGVLATANARITPDDFPYAVTLDWVDPYRVERIYRLLEGHTGLTPQSMLSIETDQHSEFDLTLARRIAYAIDHASRSTRASDDKRLRQAADLLRSWNGEMSPGSAAAAIVSSASGELWPALLTPQILAHDGGSTKAAAEAAQLYMWQERNTALESLLLHQPTRWLPPGVTSWSDLLATIVERALRDHNAPHDLSKWQYGSVHQVDIEHPLFADKPWVSVILGVPTGSGVHPIGGDATTIDATGRSFGPSERFTADLADPGATLSDITTGQSGNPASPWYLDQFMPWLHGTSFRLPLDTKSAEHVLTLVPDAP